MILLFDRRSLSAICALFALATSIVASAATGSIPSSSPETGGFWGIGQPAPVQTAPAAAPAVSSGMPGAAGIPGMPGVPGAPGALPGAAAIPGIPPGMNPYASPAPPPKPTVAELLFVMDADVNPDPAGRPSPVLVRIYELRSTSAFNQADFFSLFDRDKEQLGPDLVTRNELPLMPGAKSQAITTLRSDTRYLGIVAAFRDIDHARWRATTPVPLNQTSQMQVTVRRNEVSINLR